MIRLPSRLSRRIDAPRRARIVIAFDISRAGVGLAVTTSIGTETFRASDVDHALLLSGGAR